MKIIHLSYPIKNLPKISVVLALGFFDGVHRGHQHLLMIAKQQAIKSDLPLAVMTFDRHPSEVYAQNHQFKYLDTINEKAQSMAKLGVDYLLVMNFTSSFSKISGQEFVDNVIVKLGAKIVVAGFDYTYGPKDIANMSHLPEFAQGRFKIITVPKQTFASQKIGSTEIRQALATGKVSLATELLGHHPKVSGVVSYNLANSDKLEFPMANLEWSQKKLIPKAGIYATKTEVDGKWYESLTSIGHQISDNDQSQVFIASHLFGFNKHLYHKPITIKWYQHERDEIIFDSLQDLKVQLRQDQKLIKKYFRQR